MRAVLRDSLEPSLQYLAGDSTRKVYLIFKDIKAYYVARCKGEKKLNEKKLRNLKLSPTQTASDYMKEKSQLRNKYLLAGGVMNDAKFCDVVVEGLIGANWEFLRDKHTNVPFTDVDKLAEKITNKEARAAVDTLLNPRAGAHGGPLPDALDGVNVAMHALSTGGVAAKYGLALPPKWFDGHCDQCGYVGHVRRDCPDGDVRKVKQLRAPTWAQPPGRTTITAPLPNKHKRPARGAATADGLYHRVIHVGVLEDERRNAAANMAHEACHALIEYERSLDQFHLFDEDGTPIA